MRTIEEVVYLAQLRIKQPFRGEGLKGNAAPRPSLLVSVMQYGPVTHATRICVKRYLEGPTVEELRSYAGDPHSAAAPAFLRELSCYTDPCGMCNRSVSITETSRPGVRAPLPFSPSRTLA
jgi:hypothetical protein